MSDDFDLIPEPSVHLGPTVESAGNAIFGGVPISEEHQDRFDRMTADLVNKSSMMESASVAVLMHEMHRHLRAVGAFEDTLFDPDFIAEYCRQNPKDAWNAYAQVLQALGKKHEISEKIKKQLLSIETRGGDPSKHLHLHVVADSSQVTVPQQLKDDQQRRRLVGELLDRFRRVHVDKQALEPPKPPAREPRVVDPSELPEDLQMDDDGNRYEDD